jgi:hypothetical protein
MMADRKEWSELFIAKLCLLTVQLFEPAACEMAGKKALPLHEKNRINK